MGTPSNIRERLSEIDRLLLSEPTEGQRPDPAEVPDIVNDPDKVPNIVNDHDKVPDIVDESDDIPDIVDDSDEVPDSVDDSDEVTDSVDDPDEVPVIVEYSDEVADIVDDPDALEENPDQPPVPQFEDRLFEDLTDIEVIEVGDFTYLYNQDEHEQYEDTEDDEEQEEDDQYLEEEPLDSSGEEEEEPQLMDYSSGSGEEYVPKSDEEDDEDLVMSPNPQRKRRRLSVGKHASPPLEQPVAGCSKDLIFLSPFPPAQPPPPPQAADDVPAPPPQSAPASRDRPCTPPAPWAPGLGPDAGQPTPPQPGADQPAPPAPAQPGADQTAPGQRPRPPPETLWVRAYPPERQRDIKRRFKVRDVGPQHIDGRRTAWDFFSLFFSLAIWKMMVKATNRYAQSNIRQMRREGNLGPRSRLQHWENVTVEEMKKFFGILLNMGMRRCQGLSQYWSRRPIYFQPFYGETMAFSRFQLILSQFQVSTNPSLPRAHTDYDPWWMIRPFMDHLNAAFKRHFVPSQEICINESMVGMKNRYVFIQYMPNKRHSRFGIKKFELCDSASGYVMHVLLYSGRNSLVNKPGPFMQNVVTNLMERCDLLNKRYHLFTNNYYTKIPLAQYLLNRKTYLTGTINKTSQLLSVAIKQSNVGVGESLYFRRGRVLLVKYKEQVRRKPVHLLTTAYGAEDCEIVSRSGIRNVKPVVIHNHNQHKGGIDAKDRNIYHLTCSQQTMKYWKKLVYNFTDMALYNAFHLYRLATVMGRPTSGPVSKHDFMSEIIEHLVNATPALPVPRQIPVVPSGKPFLGHAIQKLGGGGRRLCGVCRKRARFWCPGCDVGVHDRCKSRLQHYKRPKCNASRRIPGVLH